VQAHPEASLVEFAAPTNVKDSRIISALAGLYQQAGVQGAADGRAGRFRGGNEEREKKRSWNDLFVGIPSAERRLWVQRCGLLARFPDGYVLTRPLADGQMIVILPECTRRLGDF
jgi:hypothetical protein